jgi:hypothetical protein
MGISPEFGYYRLGTEQGGSIELWQYAIPLQAERLREAVELERAGQQGEDGARRVDADAHFLLAAVHNGLRFVDALQTIWLHDEQLQSALDEFARRFPDAKNFRDVLTHMEEYVLDRGKLQDPKRGVVAAGSPSYRMTMKDGEVRYGYGPFIVPLFATATAAGDIMNLAWELWWQGLRDNVDGVDQPGDEA